jgi:hypothetical protein
MKEETMSKEAFKQIVSPEIQQAATQHAANDMANTKGSAQQDQPQQDQGGKGLFSQAADLLGAAYDVAQKPVMQGAAEVAQALFTGNTYVPYGEGQLSQEPKHGLPEAAKQQEMERGGREM